MVFSLTDRHSEDILFKKLKQLKTRCLEERASISWSNFIDREPETSVVASQLRCHGQRVLKASNSKNKLIHTPSDGSFRRSPAQSKQEQTHATSSLPVSSLQLSAGVRRIPCQG